MSLTPLSFSEIRNYRTLSEEKSQPFFSGRGRIKKIKDLEQTAFCRKIALKTIAAVTCPLTNVCLIASIPLTCCCNFPSPLLCDKEDQNDVPYCNWTTCNSPCWKGALPPKKRSDLIPLAFDPFFYCCCLSNENQGTFLLPPERQLMESLKKDQNYAEIIEETSSLPVEIGDMIAAWDPRPVERENVYKNTRSIPPVRIASAAPGSWGNFSGLN